MSPHKRSTAEPCTPPQSRVLLVPDAPKRPRTRRVRPINPNVRRRLFSSPHTIHQHHWYQEYQRHMALAAMAYRMAITPPLISAVPIRLTHDEQKIVTDQIKNLEICDE